MLEAAHLLEPKTVNGTVQEPIEGVSMLYTFKAPKAESPHKTQYFDFGNRAIYSDGWFAGTIHKAPWETQPRAKLQDDKWELYHTRSDFSLSNDLASSNPDKLKQMQALFLSEAVKYRVLPLDDRSFERGNREVVGGPDLMGKRSSLTLGAGMTGMTDNAFINIRNRSYSVTAEVDIPKGGANGVIIAQGGRFGGWRLYLKEGKPTYCYNFLGLNQYRVSALHALGPGKATIRMDFAYDGGSMGKGGTAALLVNGQKVASGRIERTQPIGFSFDETTGVGLDDSTPVSTDYKEGENSFTGKIEKVVIEVQQMTPARLLKRRRLKRRALSEEQYLTRTR